MKALLARKFSREQLVELLGIPLEKLVALDIPVDETGKYFLKDAVRAYLKAKLKDYRNQVYSANDLHTLEKIAYTKAKRMQAELLLAKAREEVIEVEISKRQAAFLLVAMRQKLLSIPTTVARKLLHQTDLKPVVNILTASIHQALKEMRGFSEKVIDPNWTGEEDG